jgi:Methyltransferase domain
LPIPAFIDAFTAAASAGTLLKCTLSKPTGNAPADLKNIFLRPVDLKKGPHIAFNYRFRTRDEVKNHSREIAAERLGELLGVSFLNANLLTTEADFTLNIAKNGVATLSQHAPSQTAPAETTHNREKNRLLDPTAPWLHTLGICSAKGEVLGPAQDKWRQINKYLETIESLLRAHPLPQDAVIADMGSGKGYLTFALYDFLTSKIGLVPQLTGIELRPQLVDFCNIAAQKADFTGLRFVAADIRDYRPERLDMLIALHACDTATDLALAAGIRQKAGIIVAAPCCHKQIRKAMQTRNELAPVLRYGILEERQAEILTDGIRALLLEAEGYKTNVFEFVSTEHTAKNVMITALKGGAQSAEHKRREDVLAKVAALKAGFGVEKHCLEDLLAAERKNS